MKKLFVITLIISGILSMYACKEQNGETKLSETGKTRISGNIINHENSDVKIQYLDNFEEHEISQDGSFSFNININEPVYLYFHNNFNQTVLFVKPNKNLHLSANYKDFNKSMELGGHFVEINDYLNKQAILLNDIDFNGKDFMQAPSQDVFVNSYKRLKNTLINGIDIFQESGKIEYDGFAELERERIMFLVMPLVLQYYNNLVNSGIEIGDNLNSLVEGSLENADLNRSDLLVLREYKDYTQHFVYHKFLMQVQGRMHEITTVKEYSEILFGIIDEYISDKDVLAEVYYQFLYELTGNYGIDGMKKYFQRYKELCSNSERIENIQATFDVWDKIAQGEPSVNFSFPDIDGNIHSLSDFEGKYVYIDVWATWCGPCRNEIPHLKKLKEELKNNNIEILAISVDQNKSDWENYVKNENLGGIQLYAGGWDNELVKHFMIAGIPRFILLDREGNIIDANANRPSGGIINEILALEGI